MHKILTTAALVLAQCLAASAEATPSQAEVKEAAACSAMATFILGNPAYRSYFLTRQNAMMTDMAAKLYARSFEASQELKDVFSSAKAVALSEIQQASPTESTLVASPLYRTCGTWTTKTHSSLARPNSASAP